MAATFVVSSQASVLIAAVPRDRERGSSAGGRQLPEIRRADGGRHGATRCRRIEHPEPDAGAVASWGIVLTQMFASGLRSSTLGNAVIAPNFSGFIGTQAATALTAHCQDTPPAHHPAVAPLLLARFGLRHIGLTLPAMVRHVDGVFGG